MPTYEYKCRECGHEFEIVQSFTDDALKKCPSCKKMQLRKVFSAPGVTFKGSGFYKTDSRSGSGKSTSGASTSSEKSSSDSSSSSSSDSSGSSSTTDTKKSDTKSSSSDKKTKSSADK